ncbi:MAG: hypothetical protein ACNS62_02435 [Candidatus Cyclobacteriaceae bacterium M3_2C_046]
MKTKLYRIFSSIILVIIISINAGCCAWCPTCDICGNQTSIPYNKSEFRSQVEKSDQPVVVTLNQDSNEE